MVYAEIVMKYNMSKRYKRMVLLCIICCGYIVISYEILWYIYPDSSG